MTIRQLYEKEYKLYIRRINRYLSEGYNVSIIPRVKRPTQASINRVKKINKKYVRTHYPQIDFGTGEVIKPNKTRKVKKEVNEYAPTIYDIVKFNLNMAIEELPEFIKELYQQRIIDYINKYGEDKLLGVLANNSHLIPNAEIYNERLLDLYFNELKSYLEFTDADIDNINLEYMELI